MRARNVIFVIGTLFIFAAAPATRPVNSREDVESNYRARAAAAKALYDAEMAKVDAERLAGLQMLLSRAMKAEDIDQAVSLKKEIDGIKISSRDTAKKIVFLCQASGSMLSVFGNAKQQLKDSVNALDTAQEFNLIFFSDDNCFPLFKDRPHAATAENKKLASDFVDSAVSTGGTQPVPSIKFALNEQPEVLYFLSDGLSNLADINSVSNAFKEGNRGGKTRINCIYLNSGDNPVFEERLKAIAEDGHGTFTKILKSRM